MKPQTLLLSLLIAAPFAAAGNLECNPQPVQQGVPTVYRCTYHNGNLAQAYTAMRSNQNENHILQLDHPHLPRTLPTRTFTRNSQAHFDYDGDGQNEAYPIKLVINRPGPNRVLVRFFQDSPATPYTRATLFERKGRNVEITISEFAS